VKYPEPGSPAGIALHIIYLILVAVVWYAAIATMITGHTPWPR